MKRNYMLLSVSIVIILTLLIGCESTKQITKSETITANLEQKQLLGPKKRIFVSEFENRTTYGQQRLGKAISDILITELTKSNLFLMLEREKLSSAGKEIALGQSGFITDKTAPEVGKWIGANAIITGAVTQFGVRTQVSDQVITATKMQVATCAVDVRIIDVNTGAITWAGSGQGEATRKYTQVLGSGSTGGYDETLEGDAFRAAVVKLIETMVNELTKIPWSCLVADIDNANIYINAGKKSNLDLGTMVSFFNPGKSIVDPSTGLEIGKIENWVGNGKIVAYLGEDAAVVQLTEGSTPNKNAIVKIQSQ